MAKLSDLWKKGTNAPLQDDLVEGGLAVDVAGKKVYSKSNDGSIFEIGGGAPIDHTHPISDIDGLQAELDSKEPDLGNPDVNGKILSSTTGGTRSWITPPQGVTEHNLLTGRDVADGHPVEAITGLQSELNSKANSSDVYAKTEYIDTSVGTGDAGKPIILNGVGQIDPSMIDASTFYYVASHDPSGGTEYPDTTGESTGAFWDVADIVNPDDPGADPLTYTFTGGDLQGKIIKVGDFMVWGTGGWSIMSGSMNPELYYRRDGTNSLTGPFAGGGQQLKNIAPGTENGDAIEFSQIDIGAY